MAPHSNPPPADYDAVVLDIEGTTTSIDFVYDTLFPFARREVERFLTVTWTRPDVRRAVELLREQAQADVEAGLIGAVPIPESGPDVRQAVVENVRRQMDEDRKTTGLKALQGLIWRNGYASGELLGHVYPDVPPALARWKAAGVPVYIYSSGSVAAQKLLFEASEAGDLTPLLAGYFDTTTGPKKDAQSYRAIATAIGHPAGRTVFVTDNLDEAHAAAAAGMHAAITDRPGNAPLPEHPYPVLLSLAPLAEPNRR